jgi:hypothetical protein
LNGRQPLRNDREETLHFVPQVRDRLAIAREMPQQASLEESMRKTPKTSDDVLLENYGETWEAERWLTQLCRRTISATSDHLLQKTYGPFD